jgi:hypothetical protein
MPLNIEVLLFLASSVIILPIVAVMTVSFFMGGLRRTEEAKYFVTRDPEEDYWALPDAHSAGRSASRPRPLTTGVPRGGEQG